MSFKDWRVRIEDILEAIERIERYTDERDEKSFCADDRSIDAVVRNLEIIGEAARRLPSEVTQRYPHVPWSHMAEMRHILVHEYHSVDPGIIWATAVNDLPPLRRPLRAILKESSAA